MKSYKQQILDYLNYEVGITWMNVKGSKYYGATFYKRNAWDGEFIWQSEMPEAMDKYNFIVDLTTKEFIKG